MENILEFLKKIEVEPKQLDNYILAITHPSYNADAKTMHQDYERLEFIGDSVLGFVCADLIFQLHPDMNQGDMSKLRSLLVRSASLSDYARQIELYRYIKVGHSISKDQIYKSNKILEDVLEAFVGALYLDQGIVIARKFITGMLLDDIMHFEAASLTDAKTKLQEAMQADHRDSVKYVLADQTGPAHDRTFTVKVVFNDIVLATGTGKTKKAAEEDAAQKALEKGSTL